MLIVHVVCSAVHSVTKRSRWDHTLVRDSKEEERQEERDAATPERGEEEEEHREREDREQAADREREAATARQGYADAENARSRLLDEMEDEGNVHRAEIAAAGRQLEASRQMADSLRLELEGCQRERRENYHPN